MKAKYIFLILLLLIYLIYTFRAQRKIITNPDLSTRKRVLHSLFIWLIPFLWYYLVEDLLVKTHKGPMTKSRRDKIRKEKRGGFYESGKGVWF